ncbi:MAG: MBL fold metallo-hydrolase [Sphingomonas sp. SCN 67-18]|uniref:MBL fold metallo-hydrolase n=1 Tax=uncultured Sphingomonas sp. TaxID=158754 RepID=UPI00086E09C5|nr:MBL fold metallo-hydrolase [Sphingomonas sp. SCN 67-18]ODU21297.1 MAG: MBL fold metallo-hydrolase [Sphingomonas sp. SCN 67-18]
MGKAPAFDASLTDHRFAPTSAKGLTYPLGSFGPGPGDLHGIAPGVGWARLPVPGSLKHINVWALDDGDGVAIVDTGLNMPAAREAWEALFAGPLAGRRVSRVIVTHFHPDHIGLAGWLCARFDVALWMNRTEFLMARLLTSDVRDAPPDAALAHFRACGWPDRLIDAERGKGWGRFAKMVSPLPLGHVRLAEGDALAIGDRIWTVRTGSGHTPEHACLVDEAGGLMIAGDQVLPRITSNVSVMLTEPEGDPLGEWLASIAHFRKTLPDDLLVLPAHGEPFTGLHARLDRLAEGHRKQLDMLADHIRAEPRRVSDCFGLLFGRAIDDSLYGLASGEALAHLRRLEREGRAVRAERDGVYWYSAA